MAVSSLLNRARSAFDKTKKFFSKEEQSKRISNTVEVVKIAINPFSKDKIAANTGSKSANKVLELAANNPYTTAAIAAGAATAARAAAPAIKAGISRFAGGAAASKSTAAITAAAVTAKSTGMTAGTVGIAKSFGIGAAAGYIGTKIIGNTRTPSNAPQDTSQQQNPVQQPTSYLDSRTWDYSDTNSTITDSPGATFTRSGVSQVPTQEQSSLIGQEQDSAQSQEASSQVDNTLFYIGLAAAIAYFTLK